MRMARPRRISGIAAEALALLGKERQVVPYSARYPGFSLAEAYDVAAQVRDLRKARGETPVGRKIGFTNTAAWEGYGISGPIWNYVFDSTVRDLIAVDDTFALGSLPEPRVEPEIVLHLASAPRAGMTEDELIGCVDWIAHGFEIVSSIFPGWRFSPVDAVAACGVHAALLLGERRLVSGDHAGWQRALADFTIELVRDDGIRVQGGGRNVLGSPLLALRFLVEEIVRYTGSEPLRAGELVTTGTLTEAMPAAGGQNWATKLTGIELDGLHLRLC